MDRLIQLVEVETFGKLLYTIRLVLWDLDVLSTVSPETWGIMTGGINE